MCGRLAGHVAVAGEGVGIGEARFAAREDEVELADGLRQEVDDELDGREGGHEFVAPGRKLRMHQWVDEDQRCRHRAGAVAQPLGHARGQVGAGTGAAELEAVGRRPEPSSGKSATSFSVPEPGVIAMASAGSMASMDAMISPPVDPFRRRVLGLLASAAPPRRR